MRQTGISEGIYEFMKDFVTDEDNYKNNPVDIITTDLFTLVFKEFEPDFFLGMVISYDKLFTNRVSNCLSFYLILL